MATGTVDFEWYVSQRLTFRTAVSYRPCLRGQGLHRRPSLYALGLVLAAQRAEELG